MDLPLFLWRVPAGFPSPAEDWVERIDLTDLLIPHPASTFFVRVSGHSMTGAGIYDGDILIVVQALEARHNNIIVALLDGEFTVKRLQVMADMLVLKAEHPDYPPYAVTHEALEVRGVVTYCIHQVR